MQFNSVAEDGETNLAFPFLVFHEDENRELSGAVWCNDERNTAGLTAGTWNPANRIGNGAPGENASWSEIGEGL